MSALDDLWSRADDLDALASRLNCDEVQSTISGDIRRSLAIRSLSALEDFFRSRAIDWSAMASRTPLAVGNVQISATEYRQRVFDRMGSASRYASTSSLAWTMREIADSFDGLEAGFYKPHWIAMLYPGSNIDAEYPIDVLRILNQTPLAARTNLHVIYRALKAQGTSGESVSQEGYQAALYRFTQSRHRAAHDYRYSSTNEVIPLCDELRYLAATLDIACSVALSRLGQPLDTDSDSEWPIDFVVETIWPPDGNPSVSKEVVATTSFSLFYSEQGQLKYWQPKQR